MPHDGLTSKDLDGTPSGSQACIAALLDAVQRSVRLDGGVVVCILLRAPASYLSAVYRDHESISRLSQDQLMSMASELGWKYHQTEGVPPFANVSCVVTHQSWNQITAGRLPAVGVATREGPLFEESRARARRTVNLRVFELGVQGKPREAR